MTQQTDVLIVGAGPIGLELAISLQAMGVDYVQVDAGQIGQTISWYPQQARFFSGPDRIALANVPLYNAEQNKASREEYLAYLRAVADHFELKVNTYEHVQQVERTGERFVVRSEHRGQPREYDARYVVLAVGDMHKPRLLNVEGEDLGHVSHYFVEPHRFYRQRLLILGGRNSAVEAALRCHRAGARVSLSYRRGELSDSVKYWLLPEIRSLMKHGQIAFYPGTQVGRITPEHVALEPSGLVEGAASAEVAADFVLLMTGYVMDPTLFAQAGVELVGEQRMPKHDAKTMQTNVPGLFVAGTAAAGTQQRYRLFIENCHPHVGRIVQAITGQSPPAHLINQAAAQYGLPES